MENDLPYDVWTKIISHLTLAEVSLLSQQSRALKQRLDQDEIWDDVLKKFGKKAIPISYPKCPSSSSCDLCGNIPDDRMKWKTKVYLRWNQLLGKPKQIIFTKFPAPSIYMPCLVARHNNLWVSYKDAIKQYDISDCFKKRSDAPQRVFGSTKHDICQFAVFDNFIAAGYVTGKVVLWSVESGRILDQYYAYNNEVNAIDIIKNTIITGSRNREAKILVWSEEAQELRESIEILMDDRVWSVALDPADASRCLVGTSGVNMQESLILYDVNRAQKLASLHDANHMKRVGSGVNAIHWESPNIVITGGYDTYIGIWDLRADAKKPLIKMWSHTKTDASVMCLRGDGEHAVLAGTQQNAQSVLFDRRYPRKMCRSFYGGQNRIFPKTDQSPVYSLAFNPRKLFVGLDRVVSVFNFDA